MDTSNVKTQVNNQHIKYWAMDLKDILDKSKQLVYVNKYEKLTDTLDTTFLNPVGGENMYVQFG